jgi:peptidoglycan/xylan/chitin deacetylase (PgdA/CDA1 family)
MTKKKQKSKKNFFRKISHVKLIGITVLVLFSFSLSIFFVLKTHSESIKHAPETYKNTMRKIPPDVKNEMDKQSSVSATLRVPILMYHYVEYIKDKNDKTRQLLNTNPDIFEKQMETLKNAGYTFMTAKELGEVLDGWKTLPKSPILITFDDGHWDLDTDILPILKKLDIKATAYIIPGFLNGSDFLTQSQLQDVVNSGLVDIGAHTVHHVALKGKPTGEVKREVEESKNMLKNEYHIDVVSFAYPYGSFDLNAINIVKDAGFTTAVSTIPGIAQSQQNRFFMYRIRPGYRTGENLLNFLKKNVYPEY